MTGRTSLTTGARAIISGSVSNNVTWSEDVDMTSDGTAISGTPENWDWFMTFRESEEDDSALLTLSTDASTLAISQGASATTLQIRVPAADLTALEGDYVCDLVSLDTSDTSDDSAGASIHWGHGRVTFLNGPVYG